MFLEANQTVIVENLHYSALSDIATSQKLLKRQHQLITYLHLTILASGREVNKSPLAVGLAAARRMDPLEVIQSSVSVTKQERRRAYRRKCSTRIKFPKFKCGPAAVEPQYITSNSSSFTDCESDFTDIFFLTFSKEGGAVDCNDSIDSVTATYSNLAYNAASDIDPISSS